MTAVTRPCTASAGSNPEASWANFFTERIPTRTTTTRRRSSASRSGPASRRPRCAISKDHEPHSTTHKHKTTTHRETTKTHVHLSTSHETHRPTTHTHASTTLEVACTTHCHHQVHKP
ncbi:hypothetical protein IscW_ISCW003102, partial [Ixodes scapularis]